MSVHRDNTRFFSLLCVVSLCLGIPGSSQSSDDFNRGVAEFQAGSYSEAAASFTRAELATPGTTDALLYQAKCFVHLQNLAEAETALRNYLARHRDSADALYLLGFVVHRQNRPAESLGIYTRAAALMPPAGDDLKIVGLNYVLLNDYPDAIKWLEKAVALDAKNKDAWYYLGRAYYTRSLVLEARKAFLRVLDLDPHDARAENNLGLVFESSAQPSAAIDAYRKAIAWQESSPHPTEQPYVNLGNLLLGQGRAEEAVSPLEKSVALAPDNASCHLKLGMAYLRIGQLPVARRELEKATQLEPDNAAAHYQLGRLYTQIHAPDLAKTEFDRAAELHSTAAKAKSSAPNP
jgi:tetratricopeptide (TPR) repeat protein